MRKWQLILVNGIVFTVINTSSFSQDICGEVSIDSAEYRYEIGRFDECIQGINNCLQVKAGFNADQKVQAYYLLAKCYLAVDMPENADSAIESLLLLKDNFETDFRDPERFRTAVLVMRSNIISSVSKQNEDIRLAPATTVIITKEEILQRGYTDLIDILKDIPGFDISVYYGQLYANVYQRGLRTNNTEKTLLLVDGVEENDLWSNFADMSQQYPVTNIKRVEIIYGPASTMYGPTAFSGVINIITKDPVDYLKDKKEIAALANTGIGSYNTRYVDISAAARKGIFSYSITGRFYQSDRPDLSKQRLWDFDPAAYDDEIPNYYYKKLFSLDSNAKKYLRDCGMPLTSPFYQVSNDRLYLTDEGEAEAIRLNKALYNQVTNEFDFKTFSNPARYHYINARVNIDDLSIGFVSWKKNEGIGTTYTDYIASVSGSRWITAHNYLYAKYNKRINEKLLFTAFFNYRIHSIENGSKITTKKDYSRLGGLELKDLQNGVPASWLTTYYYEQSEQFRSEFKLLYNQSKHFNLLSGIELRNSQLQGYCLTSTTSSRPQNDGNYPVTPGGNQYNVNDVGLYSQGSYRTQNGFGLTVGARLDYNEIRQGGGLGYELSPRFVADYINQKWVFKAIVSRGIENVSNFTKFDDINVIPNPSLKAESIYNYEIFASHKISNSFLVDIDFYYSNAKNIVYSVLNQHTLQNENVGQFKIKGVQTNIHYKSPNKKWQASVNYTYTNPKQKFFIDASGVLVPVSINVPGIASGKINAILNCIVLKNFNINIRANYVSSKETGNNISVPSRPDDIVVDGYLISNIALSAQNIIHGATVQFVCNNMFNTSYISPGIRTSGGIRYPNSIMQMGRNFFLKLNYDF